MILDVVKETGKYKASTILSQNSQCAHKFPDVGRDVWSTAGVLRNCGVVR